MSTTLNEIVERHREGDLEEKTIRDNAHRWVRSIGRYLCRTDPEERPEGIMDLYDEVIEILD